LLNYVRRLKLQKLETKNYAFRPVILVVNWNSAEKCINLGNTFSGFWPVIFIDNNSPDRGVLQDYTTGNPRVRLILQESNGGYASAMNAGMESSYKEGFTHALLLNPDIDPAVELLTYIEENFKNSDLAGFQQLEKNKFGELSAYPCAAKKVGNNFSPYIPKHSGVHEVTVVTGACLFVGLLQAQSVGWMPTKYFHYKEEFHFAFELSKAGKKIEFTNEIYVVHEGGGSLKHSSALAQYYYCRNEILFAVQELNLGPSRIIWLIALLLIQRLKVGGVKNFVWLIKGIVHGLTGVAGKYEK
jgi:GT2 family glycosyltransferase